MVLFQSVRIVISNSFSQFFELIVMRSRVTIELNFAQFSRTLNIVSLSIPSCFLLTEFLNLNFEAITRNVQKIEFPFENNA